MSNPTTNLKKGKRTPLPGLGKRQVPFRNSSSFSDKLLDDALRSPSQQSSKSESSVLKGRPHLPKLDTHQAISAPSDFDLMNGMMNKIARLELQVQYYAKEVMEKDKKINIIEEKLRLKERYTSMGNQDNNGQKLKELEQKSSELQNQIKEMEEFLADYGMVFVGSSSSGPEVDGLYEELSIGKESIWRPESSIAQSQEFYVDFDKIVQNVRELNILGGEGEKTVQHTVKGAKLTTKEPVSLTLYANGIFMFNGPFRSYDNAETKRCMQDLMDGFFPSELQDRYPEGVPIHLNDQRDIFFKDPRATEHFPGVGLLLGGEHAPSRLVPSNLDKTTNTDMEAEYRLQDSDKKGMHHTNRPPGFQMSMDQFLNKLPSTVMRDGKVIDIRSSVANNMKDNHESPSITVIKTPSVADIISNVQSGKDRAYKSRPTSGSPRVTSLRVKSESGNQTFIIKMKYEDTIQDLRAHLDKNRPSAAPAYKLVTTFPNKSYEDLDVTLEDCGLTPNATVHMKTR